MLIQQQRVRFGRAAGATLADAMQPTRESAGTPTQQQLRRASRDSAAAASAAASEAGPSHQNNLLMDLDSCEELTSRSQPHNSSIPSLQCLHSSNSNSSSGCRHPLLKKWERRQLGYQRKFWNSPWKPAGTDELRLQFFLQHQQSLDNSSTSTQVLAWLHAQLQIPTEADSDCDYGDFGPHTAGKPEPCQHGQQQQLQQQQHLVHEQQQQQQQLQQCQQQQQQKKKQTRQRRATEHGQPAAHDVIVSGSHSGCRRTPRHNAGRQTTEFSLLFGNGRSRLDTVEAPPPPVAAADPPSIARHEPDASRCTRCGRHPGAAGGAAVCNATQDTCQHPQVCCCQCQWTAGQTKKVCVLRLDDEAEVRHCHSDRNPQQDRCRGTAVGARGCW